MVSKAVYMYLTCAPYSGAWLCECAYCFICQQDIRYMYMYMYMYMLQQSNGRTGTNTFSDSLTAGYHMHQRDHLLSFWWRMVM